MSFALITLFEYWWKYSFTSEKLSFGVKFGKALSNAAINRIKQPIISPEYKTKIEIDDQIDHFYLCVIVRDKKSDPEELFGMVFDTTKGKKTENWLYCTCSLL